MNERLIESSFAKEDVSYETTLRPKNINEFFGQERVREQLEVMIQAAKERNEPLGHCLFSGPPGLGKTTLAHILANRMGTQLYATSAPILEKAGDLAGLLTNLKEGDVLFIDEIHRLNRSVEEYLYAAMEDFVLDLVIDTGPNARSVRLKLNRFTLTGATTRMGLVSSPLRTRFAFSSRLDYYSVQTLEEIVQRGAKILLIQIDEGGKKEIAKRARGTPRIANNLLRWVRDFAQIRAQNKITGEVAKTALNMLAIDDKGLDEMDKKILEIIMKNYDGGPVGLNTLSVAVGEEPGTIEEVHEPFLIMQGFIKRTPRGRELTPLAYLHIKKSNGEFSDESE